MPSVLLLGATGLVGSACLRQLLDDPAIVRVVTLTRRPLPDGVRSPKLEARVGDLERLDTMVDSFVASRVICALGTTIRVAGSQARFRVVDYDIPLAAARLARQSGTRHFLLVSSLGADPKSRVFYSRVKGELEQALTGVGFPSVSIVRPSLLLGPRKESRIGEEIAKFFSWVPLGPYAAIHADDVAAALVRLAKEERPGVRIVTSSQMRAWARERRRAMEGA